MKVLVITNGYPDYRGSYRGIFIRRLAMDLQQRGHEITILTPRVFSKSPTFENDSGIRVHRFRYPSGNRPLGQTAGGIPILPMIVYMISGFLKAIEVIAKEKPDIIHGNWILPTGLIASLAGRISRVPVINTAHGMDVRMGEKFPMSLLFDLAVKLSDRLSVVSGAMKKRRGLENAPVIPCGIDERFFEVAPSGENNVVSTRSLEKIYDVATLVRAIPLVLEEIPDARFTIAGDGSQRSALEDLASELGVSESTDFRGRIEADLVPGLLAESRIYVSTSLADGTSVSLLEAMASGLVPVVSDIEANRPWIDDTGFLFATGDEKSLAGNIIRALSERTRGLEARRSRLEESVSGQTVAERFEELYAEAVI